jgi:hypothetical protein
MDAYAMKAPSFSNICHGLTLPTMQAGEKKIKITFKEKQERARTLLTYIAPHGLLSSVMVKSNFARGIHKKGNLSLLSP